MSDTEVAVPATPKVKRGSRKFTMLAVAELPDNPPTQRNTDPIYTGKLAELLEMGLEAGHAGWVELAAFSTAAGARTVVKNFEKGEYQVPKGTDWEFETRRFMSDESKKGSKLYVKLISDEGIRGDADAAPEDEDPLADPTGEYEPDDDDLISEDDQD